jgi:hypothetical protein
MRRMVAGALSLVVAACASTPPSGPVFVSLREASIGELIGGSQEQVRLALGAPEPEASLLFDTASMIDGVQIVAVSANGIFAASDPCPSGYDLRHVGARVGDLPHRIDAFVFRNQRLDHIVGGRGGDAGAPLPADAVVLAECQRRGYGTTGTAVGDVITGVGAVVFFAPLFGWGLAAAALGSTMDESDERSHALHVIRLGAAIPGGVDAYVAAHPHAVTIVQRQAEHVELSIALIEHTNPELAKLFGVTVRDGIVQSVRAPHDRVCRIARGSAIECQGYRAPEQ